MSDVLNSILQWINTHPHLAGLATFGISAAESIAIIGTVVPGTLMMTAIGTLAGAGIIPLWATILWAILGAIVGDGVSYWLGRHFNRRLPSFWPFRTHPNLLENGEHFFRKYGWMSVLIGRFVGPVRALVPLVAGMLNMSPIRFYIANILSVIGWAPIYMLPGILLGAASLELPPDIAAHVVFRLLITILFILLGVWFIERLLTLIGERLNQLLTKIWNELSRSIYSRPLTKILKHYNHKKTHGQLVLAFYFLIILFSLLYLSFNIYLHGSQDIFINRVFFHFFRSIRTPTLDNIMLAITFLGEKKVILPTVAVLFAWLAITKRWYTAWHVFALGVIAAGGIEVLKRTVHSLRPWGLTNSPETFSFPSGHTTLTVAFYLGLTFLALRFSSIKYRRFFYYLVAFIILAISVSRLYLGVHWFTDVLGGWLLGTASFMLVAISFNRHKEKYLLKPTSILLVATAALLLSYSVVVYRDFSQVKERNIALAWPTYTVTLDAWWSQQGDHLPLYRVNRFGLSSQLLSLQWLEDLSTIRDILLKNGWQIPPQNDWISVLHRISDVNSTEHLPIVSPIYLDQNPSLVLVKHVNGDKKLIVLRLWDSRILIKNSTRPLWVGSIEMTPRTYSWLFKRKKNAVTVTPKLLFNTVPTKYDIKEITVQLNPSFNPIEQHMLLIKNY